MGLSDLICRPGISTSRTPAPIDGNPFAPVERMSLPQALNAMRAGKIQAPPAVDLLGEASDAPLPPRPAPIPRAPAWHAELEAEVEAQRQQEASDREEMRLRIKVQRQSVSASAVSSSDMRAATLDAQRRHEINRRLDQAEAQLNGGQNAE